MEKYDEMRRRSATINTLLKVIKLPILWTRRYVEAASQDKRDIEAQEFVEKALFEDLEQSRSSLLSEVLTFVDFWFSIFEQVYKVDDDWRFTLRKLAFRKQATINRREQEDWSPGVTQQLFQPVQDWVNKWKSVVSIPSTKLLRFTHGQEGDNYEWISVLRPLYVHYFSIDRLYRYDVIRAERLAMPIPTIYMPSDKVEEDKKEAQKIVKNVKAHEQVGVVIPWSKNDGREFVFTETHWKDGAAVLDSIKMHQNEIFRTGLAQFLLLWSSWAWWSYALSEDHSDLFMLSLTHFAQYISDIFNRFLVTRLVKMNFADVEKMPKLRFEKIGWVDYTKFVDGITKLLTSGAILNDEETETFVREQMWLPKKVDDWERDDTPADKKDETKPKEEKTDDNGDTEEVEDDMTDKEKEDKKEAQKNHEHYHHIGEGDELFYDEDYMEMSELFSFDMIQRLQNEALDRKQFSEIKKKGFCFNNSDAQTWRYLTFAERKVNWKWYRKQIERLEKEIEEQLWQEFANMRDEVVKAVKKAVENNDLNALDAVQTKYKIKATQTLNNIQKSMFDYSKRVASSELDVATPNVNRDVEKAMKIQSKAIVDKLTNDIQNKAKETVTEMAAKNGSIKNLSSMAATSAVSEVVDQIINKAKSSINTLAITGAVNLWRSAVYEKYPEKVYAFQYSAILDDKTTDICLSLDGRVVKPWSREYYNYTPPRHHNCRSIRVAILQDEFIKPDITWIPSSIPAAPTIDQHRKMDRPIVMPNSPAIKQLKKEVEVRKRKLDDLEASWRYPNRQKSHKEAIKQLEKALNNMFYETVKQELIKGWVKFKK